MKKTGFAISSIIYSILILFLLLVFAILSILGSRKMVLDKLKTEVMNNLNEFSEVEKEYIDYSGANKPILFDKMIPVIYEDDEWIYADKSNKWYDYDNKQWANVVILNDGIAKEIGDEIDIDTEVAMMYVWIPRYKYTIFNGNNESVPVQEINIVFERGTAKTGTVTCNVVLNQTDSSGNLISEICTDNTNESIVNGTSTYTHPAFTFGTQELTGIWVGKFENSTTDTDCNTNQNETSCNQVLPVTIKPNVISWRYAQVANFYTSISNISNNYVINNGDSHMMKNMEWGAIAYLTQSKYGRCTDGSCIEVSRNDSRYFYTGRSDGTNGSGTTDNENGSYTYDVPLGKLASTTGNIYGIYDMSGGSWEYVMGNMVNSSNQFYSSSAGFSVNPISKYYDSYTYDTSNVTHSRGRLGDAMKETLKTYGVLAGGWYDNHAYFLYSTYSWFSRGGHYTNDANAGIFYFGRMAGDAHIGCASRSVVVAK